MGVWHRTPRSGPYRAPEPQPEAQQSQQNQGFPGHRGFLARQLARDRLTPAVQLFRRTPSLSRPSTKIITTARQHHISVSARLTFAPERSLPLRKSGNSSSSTFTLVAPTEGSSVYRESLLIQWIAAGNKK